MRSIVETNLSIRTHQRERNVLKLRMVELFVFFVIVFTAREIADFNYKSNLMLVLFVLAAALQGCGQLVFGREEYRTNNRESLPLLWYSTIVDTLTVLGIVYLTGTVESPFLVLLVVPLFFASHILRRRTTVWSFLGGTVAAVALIGYLELVHVLPHFNCYAFANDAYENTHYYIGSLLVLGGFLSLIVFLASAFQDQLIRSMDVLRRRDLETKDKVNELSRLYDISLGINAVMTVETLLKMVAREATLLLSQPWASIVLFNNHKDITHSVIVGLPEEEGRRLGARVRKGGLTEHIWKSNDPVVVEDVLADKRASTGEFLMATKIRSLIGVPLHNGQHVIGVIYVGDFVRKHFQERHLRLLAIIADQLVIAIAKSRLYESIQRKIQEYEKRIEGLEKVNHLKSEYVSHVSHELRTPLTSIKAYMETLRDHIDDPSFVEKKDFLGIVSKETERLIRIVNDILDVSNMEFGQRPLQRTTFPVEEVVQEVTSMLQPKLDDKNIRLETIAPVGLPRVDADKDLITQVFINLISNAVKYSPDNTTIRVQIEEQPVDLAVSIQDEGIGIPEAQIERIFDKYFRVKSEKSKHYDGVGLGLAIVKNIIEKHGGSIRVESRENEGSTFTFSVAKEHCSNDLLGYISKGVGQKTELHEMLAVIVRMMAELLQAKIASLMLLDQNRAELFIKVSYGLDEWIVEQTRVKVGEGIAGKVAETGMPLLIDNIEKNEIYRSPNNPQYETVSLLSVPLIVDDMVVGVINVNNKASGQPFDRDDMNLLISFTERISISLERLRTVDDAAAFLQDTIEAFKRMLDKQIKTRSIERVIDHAVKTSRRLGLRDKEVRVIQYVASVHDIGMTKISDEILNKTFHLSADEIREIQAHPEKGAELIRPLEFVELVSNIILHHHERVDGHGYPMGLRGDEIPIGSRILAVIDAYQSMTSDRPYRPRLGAVGAARELVECAGKQFDTTVVGAFVDVLLDEEAITNDQHRGFKKMLEGMVKTYS